MGSQCCKANQDKEPEEKKELKKANQNKEPKGRKELKVAPADMVQASTKIQAWWRGTLLRRTLLHATLRAWVIQCWWRQTRARQLEKKKWEALELYKRQIWAAVRLQSWVRMWLTRQRYHAMLNAVRSIQNCWHGHICQFHDIFQGSYELTGSHLQLQLDIFLGSQVCRITDCIPFPIKN
ncbi:IQ domain-containing protein F5-like isoform X3 [Fukomys damarensis]|uniref:IQ domain-containing protein F5-like isoform X3 n=1 Tax=Fukomys damarensis TaxID=885580 RepID=UPI00053FF482|nr:IQ domain-containing protein F5-like isoform X3 [Fukomys damarensis]